MDHLVPESSFMQVGKCNVLPFLCVEQVFSKKLLCKIVDDIQAVRHLLLCLNFRAYLSFLNFYIVLVGQPAQCLHIAVLLMLHEKADGIAAFAAAKAFVNLFNRRNSERRRFFIVKRAQPKIVNAPLLQLYKPAYDLYYVNAALDLLYGLLGDQKKVRIGRAKYVKKPPFYCDFRILCLIFGPTNLSHMRTSAGKVYSYKKGNPYVINLVPEQARAILDIGCGAGDTGSILMEQGFMVDGITISEDEKREAGQVLRNVYVYNVEQGLPPELQEQYDVVILSHVLEHICYPQKLLKDVQGRLKPNGILIIALPNIMHFNSRWKLTKGNFNYEEYGIWDYTHFRWYTFKSAQQMLKDNNYTVEKADVSGWIPFEHRLKKITPSGFRNGLFRMLKKISPGLFGFQLLYVAKPNRA